MLLSFGAIFTFVAVVAVGHTSWAAPSLVASQVTFSNYYDDASASIDTVACSNGANGLNTRFGFKTLGNIPGYPLVGAAPSYIGIGFNSTECGACWSILFRDPVTRIPNSITITIIDVASEFILTQTAFDDLAAGNGIAAGGGPVQAIQVSDLPCDFITTNDQPGL